MNDRLQTLRRKLDNADRAQGEYILMMLLSLLATVFLFHDYLPWWKKVHFWSDTEGFHWPLLNYAFMSLKEGRFPLWDPSIYCGIPFAGNIQAGLFYPPNWLMFASQWHRPTLSYMAIEILMVLHIWIAFVFAYCWLRLKTSHWLPTAMGAAVVAFCGYMLSQTVHLGVTCGYAWMPFALWGIAKADAVKSWKPLWRTGIGLAMCLLAGYPATFIAFVVLVFAYALALPRRMRLVPQVALATLAALLLSAVQLLPTMDLAESKVDEVRYGGKLRHYPEFYLLFLFPNYYDQNRVSTGVDVAEEDSMYLGAAALLGILLLLRSPLSPWAWQALVITLAFLVFLENPWHLVSTTAMKVPRLIDALRNYNFLAGMAFPAALLISGAVNRILVRDSDGKHHRIWVAGIWITTAIAWCVALLVIAKKGGVEFSTGLNSGYYALATVILLAAGIFLYSRQRRAVIAVTILLVMLCEYRVFNVNRKFNAVDGDVDAALITDYRGGGRSFSGMDDSVFQRLRENPDRRIAMFQNPFPTDFRHYGLASAQGFDPFVNKRFKALVERFQPFRTDRLFDMDVENPEMLRTFGVSYVMAIKDSDEGKRMRSLDSFQLLEPADSFYQVFEAKDTNHVWRFDAGNAEVLEWSPEQRRIRVHSANGGELLLLEQNLPGWTARLDGKPHPISSWEDIFQRVQVEPGTHELIFSYSPRSVYRGAAISLTTLCAGLFLLFYRKHEAPIEDGNQSSIGHA